MDLVKKLFTEYLEVFYRQKDLKLFRKELDQEISEVEIAICKHLKAQREKTKAHTEQKEVSIRNKKIQQQIEHICQLLVPKTNTAAVDCDFDMIAGARNINNVNIPKDLNLCECLGLKDIYSKRAAAPEDISNDESSTWINTLFYSDQNLHRYDLPPRKFSYQFQPEWASNIAIFLPDNPKVLQIFPFLFVCYILNIPRNKLDFFSTDEIPEFLKIYYDNPTRAQKNMARNFCYGKDRLLFSLDTWLEDEYAKFEKSDMGLMLARTRDSMRCWELTRCFAACILSCKDIKEVNFTLSYILFSGLFMFNDEPTKTFNFTWEDIKKDCERDDILKDFLPGKDSGMSTSVDEIAYYAREDFYEALRYVRQNIPQS